VTIPKWFRRRRYLHFDLPVNFKHALSVVTESKTVETHAFYPFIRSTITAVKLSKKKGSNTIKRQLKPREIACAAHLDSHIYAYYGHVLGELYEEQVGAAGLSSCVLAFRVLGKSNIDFALEAFSEIAARPSCDVIALDIKGFFDNLDHGRLKRGWAKLLGGPKLPPDHFNVYRSLTKSCTVDKLQLYSALHISPHNPTKGHRRRVCGPKVFRDHVRGGKLLSPNTQNKGIPQGSPISALLSNIYMFDFDSAMHAYAVSIGGRYMRYCDDMMIIGPAGSGDQIKAFAHDRIKEAKLEIQDEKTEERTFTLAKGRLVTSSPLQYLGFVFDGKNLRIRSGSVLRYFDRMRRGIKVALRTQRRFNKVRAAEGRNETDLHRKKLYKRYSYLGRRNFVSYGNRAAATMSSGTVRKQIRHLWKKLRKEMEP
jgi:RNA-directed DNA polymerase